MRILGIDTTTGAGGVALAADGRLVGSLGVEAGLDHSENLLPAVEQLLGRLGWRGSDLDGVAVTVGPGSFTGVRVGLATARGLARAWSVPAVGLSSLEALARAAPRTPAGAWICPWIDAGRGEVYAAAYLASAPGAALEPVREPGLTRPAEWLASLPACPVAFLGDGARSHAERIVQARGPGALAGTGPWFLAGPAALEGEGLLRRGEGRRLEPLYLRPSDAETGRGRSR